MAEFMMKEKIHKLGLSNFYIASAGTSSEEEGNDLYPGAKRILDAHGNPYERHFARKLEMNDYHNFDYFICMERRNVEATKRIFGGLDDKVFQLLEKDVADPWYTGDFETTYRDLDKGLDQWIQRLLEKK